VREVASENFPTFRWSRTRRIINRVEDTLRVCRVLGNNRRVDYGRGNRSKNVRTTENSCIINTQNIRGDSIAFTGDEIA